MIQLFWKMRRRRGPRSRGVLEADELDTSVTLLGLIVAALLAAHPGRDLAVALDGRRRGFQLPDHRADGVVSYSWVEGMRAVGEFIAERPRCPASAWRRSGRIAVQPISAARRTMRNWTLPALVIILRASRFSAGLSIGR